MSHLSIFQFWYFAPIFVLLELACPGVWQHWLTPCCEMRLFLRFSNTVRSFDFFAVQVSKIPLCLHRHHHPNVRLAVLQNIGQKVTISNFALWDLRSSEALSVYLHAQLCPLDDWLKLISIFFRSVPNFIFQLQSCSVCEEESYGVVSPCVTSNAVKCDN